MSTAYNKKIKYRKTLKTPEEKRVSKLINKGDLPRFFLAKETESDKKLERKFNGKKRKLTWRQLSTLKELSK